MPGYVEYEISPKDFDDRLRLAKLLKGKDWSVNVLDSIFLYDFPPVSLVLRDVEKEGFARVHNFIKNCLRLKKQQKREIEKKWKNQGFLEVYSDWDESRGVFEIKEKSKRDRKKEVGMPRLHR